MKSLIVIITAVFLSACASWKTMPSYNYKIVKDIPYSSVNSKVLSGDLYLPDSQGPRGAVLVVHGGGWSKRSGDMEKVSKKLARSGLVVFNINYRLAPEYRFPAPVEDVSAALAWLFQHAEDYQIDPQRIAGWGYSAGAHLILMAGLDRSEPPVLSGIVAGGTPADLTAWPKSPLVYDLIGATLSDAPDIWQAASPVNRVSADSPPVFLYHGEWDMLVESEQMEKMSQSLQDKGVEVQAHPVRFLGHVGTYFMAAGAEQQGIEFILGRRANGT